MENKAYYSTTELAALLGISRVTVFNKIKKGEITAEKIGRNYIIPRENTGIIAKDALTDGLKHEISHGVAKVIDEYGDVLKRLGKE